MKNMDQPEQQPTQSSRDETGAMRGSGRSSDSKERRQGIPVDRVRNAESTEERSRSDRSRSPQDDLILHDDDEAELDLPR